MPSPFPGMDPFIEGQVWTGFHHHLIAEINAALVPQLRPRYRAYVEERVYVSHEDAVDTHTSRPDVTVARPAGGSGEGGVATAVLTAPLTVALPIPEEVREPYLEVRLGETREVVAVIEVLSPGNKRPGGDGRREYLQKRDDVLRSGAHLIEIDLLRGGERLPTLRPLPERDYILLVSRAARRPTAEVWPVGLREPLPHLPVPLAGRDPDAVLDLQAAVTAVYDRAGYDYLLDYAAPVSPPLPAEDEAWARGLLAARAGAQGL
jgi:hypothetical protein